MDKNEWRGRIGVRVGSVRIPKGRVTEKKTKDCSKCGGPIVFEGSSDYFQDGVESYDVERCLQCGNERRFNIEWMALFS